MSAIVVSAQDGPQFDVVSIKPAVVSQALLASMAARPDGACGQRAFSIQGNRVTLRWVSVCDLIRVAYDVRGNQVVGPAWIRELKASSFFAFDARAPQDPPLTQGVAKEMLKAMLADRFKLRIWLGDVETNVFNLVVSKGGAKLDSPDRTMCASPTLLGGTTFVHATGRSGMARCDLPEAMRDIASDLSAWLDRPVIDKTGIETAHTYSVQWAPERGPNPNSLPGMFTAIEEQMGLRLEVSATRNLDRVCMERAY